MVGAAPTVALVALSVRGAMGQYVEALGEALSRLARVHLFVPDHFSGDVGQCEVHGFPTGRSRLEAFSRLANPVLGRGLWTRIRSVRPDIVHLFNGEGYPWGLLVAGWAQSSGLPLVVTVHDPEPHPGDRLDAVNAALRPWTLRRASIVHVHSRVFAPRVQSQGVPAERLRVIPHGSLAPRFTRYCRGHIPREPLALFFGRVLPYKGLDVLVAAASLLRGKLRVAIAGPGRIPEQLLWRIRSEPETFELHAEYLDDRHVATLFQRSAVCVMPYLQASQSSLPLIAAGFRVPVVASAVGALVEDVARVGGILVQPGEPEALAAGILAALDRCPVYPADLDFGRLAHRYLELYLDAVGIRR